MEPPDRQAQRTCVSSSAPPGLDPGGYQTPFYPLAVKLRYITPVNGVWSILKKPSPRAWRCGCFVCAPCGSLSSDLTPCESGIAEDLWLFFNPSRYVVPFALSPTHYVDLPPTSVVTCISCSLCFTHSCHVWFSSYYPTLLRTGRSVPSSRPHHASGPLTHNPVTSSRGPAGHALGSRPLHGPPVTLYTTGPNHARRLMSRHPRPPSWSR